MSAEKTRVDKWLWAIRCFKTRSKASEACNAGRVKIEGKSVKGSKTISTGDTITVQFGKNKKVLEVAQVIEKRVGAKLADDCYIDHSPEWEYDEHLPSAFMPFPDREKGMGRPTKKERRKMDRYRGEF